MKKLITFLIFALTSALLYSQESKKDSLLYQLELKGNLSEPDSTFFNKLNNNVLISPNGTRYYIKEFIPDLSIDYKILEVVVDSTIEYKIMKTTRINFIFPIKQIKNCWIC